MAKFGDFVSVAKEHGQGAGSEWFRPPLGESKVRLVSEFEIIAKHWRNDIKRTAVCYGKEKGCPYHGEKEQRAKIEYLIWLIDRKDKKLKIAALPYSVMKKIADWKTSTEYGYDVLPLFDVVISKKKTGERQMEIEYDAVPSRKDSPLTDEEQEMILDEANDLSEVVQKMKDKAAGRSSSENSLKEVAPNDEETEIRPEDLPF